MRMSRGRGGREAIAFAVERGRDLHEELSAAAAAEDWKGGFVACIGALERARLAYYDQETHGYETHEFAEPVEIASCSGNVTLKEGRPFVHLHMVVSGRDGRAHGGHVLPGCVVFACEGWILPFGGTIARRADAATGLHVWDL